MSDAARNRARLVDGSGQVRVGIFVEPIGEVNHRDFDLRDPFGRRVGGLRRHLAFNQFQFLGALSEELVFGCAIADLKYAGTAFAYAYEPATRRFRAYSFRRPFGLGTRFDPTPESGSVSFASGRNRIEMSARERPRERRLAVRLPHRLHIDAVFHEEKSALQPMCICTRVGASGWVFARKSAGVAVSGALEWEGRSYDLGALGALGHCDWSAGFMRRRTFWNWGCLASRLPDGRAVGMNVSCGVNETSFTENCLWIDGRIHKLDSVHFEYDRNDLDKPWRLSSFDERLQLEFRPEGKHREIVNTWVIASNFTQLIGRYHGWLETEGRERIEVDGALGYAESHYAKW